MDALRRRRLVVIVVLVLIAVGFGLWLNRDVPRATVAARLAEALDARVRLGALEIVGPEHVVLRDVRIDQPKRLPALRRAVIERVDVFGSLSEIRGGRIREVVATGSRVILQPTEPLFAKGFAEAAADGVPLVIGRAVAERVEARLAAVGERPEDDVAFADVELDEVGDPARIAGTVDGSADTLGLGLLFARFGLSVDGRAADAVARWDLDTAAERDELTVTTGRLDLTVGEARVSFDALRGRVDQHVATARIDGDRGIARGGGARLDLGSVGVDATIGGEEAPSTATITSAAWSDSRWQTADGGFTGSIDALRLDQLTPPAELPALDGDADVAIDASADRPRITVDARPSRIRPPDAEPIELTPSTPPTLATLDARLDAAGEVVIERLRWSTDLALWRRLANDRLPESVRSFSLGGRASGDWRINGERFTGPLRLDGVGAVSDDGARVVDGLAGSWQVEGRWTPEPRTVEARLNGRHDGFQLLWQTVYADFSTAGAALDVETRWHVGGWSTAIAWQPDDGPTVQLDLTVEPQVATTYSLEVDDVDLGRTFATYLRPLTAEVTTLDDLAGGLRLKLSGSLGDAATARGRLELTGARVATSDSAVEGLHLDLPIDVQWAPDGIVGPQLDGRVAFSKATTRGFTLPAILSRVQIEGDDVGLVESLRLSVLGGHLVLDRATLRDLLGAPIAETGLRIDGIDLGRLAADLGLPAVEGRLDGHLPRVRVVGDALRVDGGGTIRAFGGEIALFDLAGREIFSDFPELSFSAEIDGLDLGQLTRRFDVGEMTGILDGRIEECRLFRGMPTAFRARFESVDRDGVEQTVDVKAVRNLTILGTGADPGALDRGLTRLLSRFRYSELGVEVSLDRDILLLRGLVQRDDKELFLAGRFPFGIDVVNARPGQTVSFQTMVRRLQALDTSRVRSE